MDSFYLPGIIEALAVAAWVVRLAAVVPGSHLGGVSLAGVEARDQVLRTGAAPAAGFSGHGVVAPGHVAFSGQEAGLVRSRARGLGVEIGIEFENGGMQTIG